MAKSKIHVLLDNVSLSVFASSISLDKNDISAGSSISIYLLIFVTIKRAGPLSKIGWYTFIRNNYILYRLYAWLNLNHVKSSHCQVLNGCSRHVCFGPGDDGHIATATRSSETHQFSSAHSLFNCTLSMMLDVLMAFYILDSILEIDLSEPNTKWATFSDFSCELLLHLLFLPDMPSYPKEAKAQVWEKDDCSLSDRQSKWSYSTWALLSATVGSQHSYVILKQFTILFMGVDSVLHTFSIFHTQHAQR